MTRFLRAGILDYETDVLTLWRTSGTVAHELSFASHNGAAINDSVSTTIVGINFFIVGGMFALSTVPVVPVCLCLL